MYEPERKHLRILLATGGPTLPQMIGGSQRSGDTLLRELNKRGHHVALTAALMASDWIAFRARILMKLRGCRAILDNSLGYPTYRSWFPTQTAEEVVRRFNPDVVVVQAHSTGLMAKAFKELDQRILFSFQDVEFEEHGYDIGQLSPIFGVANSKFTARAYEEKFGAAVTVINPIIDPTRYRVEKTGGFVTFINPTSVKGLDIAIETASLLPEIPFRFQETWPMGSEEREKLLDRLSATPNISLEQQVEDMREVYTKTRILLCPSQWNEGYGRIATEAQISGIPVIGSNRGGLPEAIGRGGIVIPSDAPAEQWAEAIRILWNDRENYEKLSENAKIHAERENLSLERQIDLWEEAIYRAAQVDPIILSR